jgi:hypothetical protein
MNFPTSAAVAILALATLHLVAASDPSPLQDFCVALNTTQSAYDAGIYCVIYNWIS